jgi:hypothetical protein
MQRLSAPERTREGRFEGGRRDPAGVLSGSRGLGDPLLVVSDGAPGIILAIEKCFPPSARHLAHRMRNLAIKVSADRWPEFKARGTP